ncbi:hypothetical protein LGL08_00450 [Clostridium estertheticum]|uniref:hypothetical protein n=1 Tax=Clostridium estertheticum TaxID=238834 RepID=UPI001CF16370|nr:hypothetical protein [Clostridium estertheticum]MCB2305684.1 hypothetical protein [Clostridium estertheticum]MCB2344501.1 hypothetical protein [Clostridium estertheticum]MCB2348039.1 hypothetical protein [Clostridium estertheticum]WAG45682.1 hypothetical protein LL127_19540 [Clostridium estertheticum]
MPMLNNTIEILNSKSTKILFGDLYGQEEEIIVKGILEGVRKYGAVNINSLLA